MRILSGIQPTGELHVGNWLGAVRNWVALQDPPPLLTTKLVLGLDGKTKMSKSRGNHLGIETLRPMRERAAALRKHSAELRRVLDEGREAASVIAGETMDAVRSPMGLWQTPSRIPTA